MTLPRFLGEFNGRLAFSATTDSGIRELYVTDGTQAGTTRLTNFSAAKSYNVVDDFAVAGGKIYFTALPNGLCQLHLALGQRRNGHRHSCCDWPRSVRPEPVATLTPGQSATEC